MSEENPNDDAKRSFALRKLRQSVRRGVKRAGETAVSTSKKTVQLRNQLKQNAGTAVGQLQRRLGEDYYAILGQNPLVLDTLSREALLQENELLLQSAFSIPWRTSLFWGVNVGTVQILQHDIAKTVGQVFHYGPGHLPRWAAVNRYMDQVSGSGHRLKFGHSIDHLPEIVERFGIEGVPAYTMHLLQDFTTVDGIPMMPNAWEMKTNLQALGLKPKTAAGLVSLSFTGMLGAMLLLAWVSELWKMGGTLVRKRKMKQFLETAVHALQHGDHKTAATNYEFALEVDQNPYVMMALGQVYAQHGDTRFKSHRIIEKAFDLLAAEPGKTMPYNQAQLSVRGMAGVQALATVDAYEGLKQDFWNEHLSKLVQATCYSFGTAAQAQQAADRVPDVLVNPAQFSAALNYYLAAKTACYYPFLKERQSLVETNLAAAQRALGMVAQYDEENLRQPIESLRQLWDYELLAPQTTP
ncbi:MAG: hypothetical protein CL608_13830 [Anaerolineaceae bacterium]|nr:hypothetical protein [Anaerolineaceae bacterium]